MVLKRKELIAASLVVLIGVAGYLNWSYQDTMRVEDNELYTETGKRLGETEYVNADVTTEEVTQTSAEEKSDDYFEKARAKREEARAEAMQILNDTIANENFDEEI